MLNLFKKASAALLLLIVLITQANASGKMEVQIGEVVSLQAQSKEQAAQYKWVVTRGNDIITTQANRLFNYQFLQQGEYEVNLTATSGLNVVENTSIMVLVGDRYKRPSIKGTDADVDPESLPTAVNATTLPEASDDGRIHLQGDGKLFIDLSNATGTILEYRVDENIFEDSDGNGSSNDDIDNINDKSYLVGGFYEANYEAGQAPKIITKVTLVDDEGQKAEQQFEIVIDEPELKEGDTVAKLLAAPKPRDDDKIHLVNDVSNVAFYARESAGKALEYRIDKNIFFDSDGDGNPANDIDNKDDKSFKDGDVWVTQYERTDSQIIAQLITVGEGGKGSRIQRGIVFDEKKQVALPKDDEDTGIRIVADKDFVLTGDPISYTVKGLALSLDNYTFEWDFDGDITPDQVKEGDNTAQTIYDDAGFNEVSVLITDTAGNSAIRKLEVLAKQKIVTKADFTFEVSGNTVTFNNLSTASANLADQSLEYRWSFGDSDEANFAEQQFKITEENPSYEYKGGGNYLVTLTVTDADQVINVTSKDITIEGQVIEVTTPEETGDTGFQVVGGTEPSDEGGSLIGGIFKAILYLILFVIILVVIILGGFLTFLKVQHPDLTFDELVDELRVKLLGMMGVHEMIEPTAEAAAPAQPEAPQQEAPTPEVEVMEAPAAPQPEVKVEPTPAPAEPVVPTPEPVAPVEPTPAPEAPVQDTVAGRPVIDTEVVPETPAAPVEPTPAPAEPVVPTPEPVAPAQPESAQPVEPTPAPAPTPTPEQPAAPAEPAQPETPQPGEQGGDDQNPPVNEQGPMPDWLKG